MLLPTTKKLHALCDGREEQSQSEDELETVELNGGEELPELPWDPMWTQVDFRMQSLHFLKLYGHEYDYGILPNVDLEIKYAVSEEDQAASVGLILITSSIVASKYAY